ncbi:MAG: TetR/AcrR family transcriptional regulator [Clostridia bacterium]|nr:TetR/AcrR family transcriptional regulator [Clostridia bacterium]MBR3554143.1 TetR/AcrR family transcriptional regulator [Clostridia bacterium]
MAQAEKEVFHKSTFDNIPQEKRNKILEVATREFAACGFENANINTIAKKAGVSVGSLYKYFDTKSDLFLTTVSFGIDTLEQLLEQVTSNDEDLMIKFEKILRAAIRFSREMDVMIKLYNEFTTESNVELGRQLIDRMEALTARAYKMAIVQGQVAGEVRLDIDPGMAAFLVDNILMSVQFAYSCTYYAERLKIYAGDDIFQKDDFVIENILRFVKAALKPQKYPERIDQI